MGVEIDKDACIDCGVCTTICPDVFEIDGEGKTVVVAGAEDGSAECCQDAADQCPTEAITIG